jgi:hypothetical protein
MGESAKTLRVVRLRESLGYESLKIIKIKLPAFVGI